MNLPGMNLVPILLAAACAVWMPGCGQHSARNLSQKEDGDSFRGEKAQDPPGKMLEAIGAGDLASMLALLDAGLGVDTFLPNGRTALIESTLQVKPRLVHELLARGANKDLADNNGKTAVEYARENGNGRIWLQLDRIVSQSRA
ncbi:MAG: ankyrin repeat domain-containing protein, partial [Calothrix sp. SM1_5_4]|nr:ankyrin repeat domain-containing protein [Calothrix sp. SM1_5_4]